MEQVPPIAPVPTVQPRPALTPRTVAPFAATAPPSRVPPSWPAKPLEPPARPPLDPATSARIAEMLASRPVRPPSGPSTPLAVPTSIRPRETTIRAAVYAPPSRRRIGTIPVFLTAASLILFLASAVLLWPAAKPSQVVADATDAPTATLGGVAVASEPAPAGTDASSGPDATDQPVSPTEPTTGGGGTGPGPTPRPGSTARPTAKPTPTPPGATPSPTPSPTPTPAPTPTPTPGPTPSPGVDCVVITLINHWTNVAQHQWESAGFTGTVVFNPAPPPNYHIKWQSLSVGSTVPCSSDITVRDAAP